MGSLTQAQVLGAFVAEAKFDTLPDWAVTKAVDHTLDTLGVMLAGLGAEETLLVRQTIAAASGTGPDAPMSPRDAALVRGVAAHAYELDDSGGCDHSGAVVWPAILSALSLSDRPVSGREVLLAMVLGYDLGRRVLMGFGGYVAHNDAGWHSTGTCGVFGAAAAAARILGLDAAQTAAALGIAGSFASGTRAFIHDGAMNKRIHTGRTAESGLMAVLMARQGMTGAAHVFENVWGGFYRTYGHGPLSPEALTDRLGEDWLIRDAAIKPHACCRDTHAGIDAIARMQVRTPFAAQDVARIEATLSPFLIGMVGGRDVSSMPAAQMSLPYGMAAQICFGAAGLDEYAPERRKSRETARMLDLIDIIEDETVKASSAARVTLTLRDGRQFEERTTHALGTPGNPMSTRAVRAKFDQMAGRTLTQDRVRDVAACVLSLATCEDARQLVQALAP